MKPTEPTKRRSASRPAGDRGERTWPSLIFCGAATAVSLLVLGCSPSGSMTHLIPDGYVGPVVIVFEDPSGEPPVHDEGRGVVYKISADGVLRLSTPAPEAGLYLISYFYVGDDGSRKEIPRSGETSELQVFAKVDGATSEQDDGKPIRWAAYVVGVPKERDDWAQVRGEATSRAIGIPGLQ